MKIISVIVKSLREQVRSYWVLLLTLSMGPFFILIYFLITETSKPQYNILISNHDKGIVMEGTRVAHGIDLENYFIRFGEVSASIPLKVAVVEDQQVATGMVKKKKADALIIINESFSYDLEKKRSDDTTAVPSVEFIGDLSDANYLITAIWANEILNEFSFSVTNTTRIITVKETALGSSAGINSFNMMVPGILIVSLIMLMFTASIAFVAEVENRTIVRLKLSKLKTIEFITGISIVQLMVGISSVIVTLLTAILLGFQYKGSLLIMIFIAGLTSLSVISFSLIIAAVTKSADEVLVVGNFPMFLFMFFTGAAFPLKSSPLFIIADYPITFQGLMTPTHAISALNKTLVMNMNFASILPEIISIVLLSGVYFFIGALIFRRRHLRLG